MKGACAVISCSVSLLVGGCHLAQEQLPESSATISEELSDYTWSGIGFGIDMSFELQGVSEIQGDRISAATEQRIQELEQSFSLYLENSELRILNRERALHKPTQDFLNVLQMAELLSRRTKGYYQPAIHGAWSSLELRKSDPEKWVQLCEEATLKGVKVSNVSVEMTQASTQLSFNALVQGYLADQVKDVIVRAGVKSAVLHLGETYGVGEHPEGRAWKLAVMGSRGEHEVDQIGVVEFSDSGLAVSAHDEKRQLLNPKNWTVNQQNRVVAVISSEGATVADAFATAFAVAPPSDWEALYVELGKNSDCQVKVWVESQLVFDR